MSARPWNHDGGKEPRVSVLLPVYNGEPYLREAVQSILAQSYSDFELLAVDDGSRDGSLDTLEELAGSDSRMRVITRSNRGLVATLNELIGMARGELLARMDADDVCLPTRFAEQVRFLDQHAAHVLVGTRIEYINARGQRIGVVGSPLDHGEIEEKHLAGHSAIAHPSAMMRRTAVEEVGGYRAEQFPAEDLDLWLRLGELGLLANLPSPLVRYRIHHSAVSVVQSAAQRRAAKRACEAAWQRRGCTGTFEASSHWRAGDDAASRHDYALRYGWMAWNSGHRSTARSYLWQALRLKPWSVRSWQLAYGVLLKNPPERVRFLSGGVVGSSSR